MNDRLLFQTSNQQHWCVEAFQENWSMAVLPLEEEEIEAVCMPQKGRQHANTHTYTNSHTRTHTHAHAHMHACTHAHTRIQSHTHTHTHACTHAHAHTITITMCIVPLGYKWFAHTNTSLFTLLCQLAIRAMNFIITKESVIRSCCSMEWVHKQHVSTFYHIWHLSRYWHADTT